MAAKPILVITFRPDPMRETELSDYFHAQLDEHEAVGRASRTALLQPFARLVELSEQSIRRGGKLLLFGNGGSASDAQHIAAELTVDLTSVGVSDLAGSFDLDPSDFSASLATDAAGATVLVVDTGSADELPIVTFEATVDSLPPDGDAFVNQARLETGVLPELVSNVVAVPLLPPWVAASLTDMHIDSNANGKLDFGEFIRYTAVVRNEGAGVARDVVQAAMSKALRSKRS